MRHVRSLITTLIGLALWSVAATTTAFAALPDPAYRLDGRPGPPVPPVPDSGTSFWQYALIAAIAALLTVAVVGLIASLRHSRTEPASSMLQA